MAALDNEKRIFKRISDKYKPEINKAKPEIIDGDLKVSVDFIWKEKDFTFLFEVDSYNAAKMIFGEYILLNQIKTFNSKCLLIIIHCYPNYKKERTIKYLKFATDNLECRLPFIVYTESEWNKLLKTKSKNEIINIFKNKIKLKK